MVGKRAREGGGRVAMTHLASLSKGSDPGSSWVGMVVVEKRDAVWFKCDQVTI